MSDIKAIKRHSKRRRIHIYSKIIYNHFLRSSHKKKTPGDPVSSLFGPKPPYGRRSERLSAEGGPAGAHAKRSAGPESYRGRNGGGPPGPPGPIRRRPSRCSMPS